MHSIQKAILGNFGLELNSVLDPEAVVSYLQLKNLMGRDEGQWVLLPGLQIARNVMLLERMILRTGWWDTLMEYLEETGYSSLQNKMKSALLAASNRE